jgi:hypothetical protein
MGETRLMCECGHYYDQHSPTGTDCFALRGHCGCAGFRPAPAVPDAPVGGEPACPDCGKALQPVRYEGGYLNRDQWESVRAGDWFCDACKGTRSRSGYRYFWNRELAAPSPVSDAPGGAPPTVHVINEEAYRADAGLGRALREALATAKHYDWLAIQHLPPDKPHRNVILIPNRPELDCDENDATRRLAAALSGRAPQEERTP